MFCLSVFSSNWSVQLWVKSELEIEGIWKNTKSVSTYLCGAEFWATTVYFSIYKEGFLAFLQAFLFQKSGASGLLTNVSNF